MGLKVIDNFLPQELFDSLKQAVESVTQPWYPYEKIDHELVNLIDKDQRKLYGFSCDVVKYKPPYMYERFPCTALAYTFHQKVKDEYGYRKVIRCRLDRTSYRGETVTLFGPHTDLEGDDTTTVFHLTTCNGPTIIYNEKSEGVLKYVESLDDSIKFVPEMDLTVMESVDAVENRLIMFDGDQVHSGSCATDVAHRVVINSNFVTAEKFAERYE